MRSCNNCLNKINKKCSGWVSASGLDKETVCRGYISGKQMTNADKIRAMSDEELADTIFWFVINCAGNPDYIKNPHGYLEWLQCEIKESEEE